MAKKNNKPRIKYLAKENMLLEEALRAFDLISVRPFKILSLDNKRNFLLRQFFKFKRLREVT